MRGIAPIAALAGAILAPGYGSVKIGRINAAPSRFRNQTVHVTGTVVASVGVLGTRGRAVAGFARDGDGKSDAGVRGPGAGGGDGQPRRSPQAEIARRTAGIAESASVVSKK